MKYLVSNSTLADGVTYTINKTGGSSPSCSVTGTKIITTARWDENTNYTSYCYALLSETIKGRGQKITFTATAGPSDYHNNPDSYMVLYDVDANTYTKIASSPYTMPKDGKSYKIGGYAFIQGFGYGTGTVTYTYQLNEVAVEGGNCYVKISGQWKEGTTYIKVNGQWKQGEVKVKHTTWKGA